MKSKHESPSSLYVRLAMLPAIYHGHRDYSAGPTASHGPIEVGTFAGVSFVLSTPGGTPNARHKLQIMPFVRASGVVEGPSSMFALRLKQQRTAGLQPTQKAAVINSVCRHEKSGTDTLETPHEKSRREVQIFLRENHKTNVYK